MRGTSPVPIGTDQNHADLGSKPGQQPHQRSDRDSPPPGTYPQLVRSLSRVSCGSEGEFIPEKVFGIMIFSSA